MIATSTRLSLRNKSTEAIIVRSTSFTPFPMALSEQTVAAYSEAQIDAELHFDSWWYSVDVYSQDGSKLAEKNLVSENSALVFLGASDKGYVLE